MKTTPAASRARRTAAESLFGRTEGIPAAALYGATGVPTSEEALETLFEATASRLERSDIVFEFLVIMRSAPILPPFLKPTLPSRLVGACGYRLIICMRERMPMLTG